MTPTPLSSIATWANGTLYNRGEEDFLIKNISTDSRTIQPNDLYLPLKGEYFDGHDFIPQALEKGATAFFSSEKHSKTPSASPCIYVKDTLLALQQIATQYRKTLDIPIISITGSNGKTSTKDFLHAILSERFPTLATKGNLNNHIGLPLTILQTTQDHQAAIWEMGINHTGEMDLLCSIAKPTTGIITNIGNAHLEHFKTRETIAQEKGKLAEILPASGHLVLHAEDTFTPSIMKRTSAQISTVGFEKGDFRATNIRSNLEGSSFEIVFQEDPEQSHHATIPVPGKHMILNALMAVAIARHLNLTWEGIIRGLQNVTLSGGRLQTEKIRGITFLNDSYNANPNSMRAALETLQSFPAQGKKIAVLGHMAELGNASEEAHLLLGKTIFQKKIDVLLTVGESAKYIHQGAQQSNTAALQSHHFAEHQDCVDWLSQHAQSGDVILLKGSRLAAMEKILHLLENA